jgi:heme A synthase
VSLLAYIWIISLTMYTVKESLSDWEEDVNYVRIWLLIETIFFFAWIMSGCLFLSMAQLAKFRSTLMTDSDLSNDRNPWNDRKTDDFFRYIKFDYFVFTLYLCCLIMDVSVGFYQPYSSPYGRKDMFPTV